MSVLTLMTEPVQVLVRTPTGGFDNTGEEEVTFELSESTTAFVSRTGSTENITGRDQVVVDWTMLLPPDVVVSAYDRLSLSGDMFEVVGKPEVAYRPGSGPAFQRLRVRHVEG